MPFIVHTHRNGVIKIEADAAEYGVPFYFFFNKTVLGSSRPSGLWRRLVTGERTVSVSSERREYVDLVKTDDILRIQVVPKPARDRDATLAKTPTKIAGLRPKARSPGLSDSEGIAQ